VPSDARASSTADPQAKLASVALPSDEPATLAAKKQAKRAKRAKRKQLEQWFCEANDCADDGDDEKAFKLYRMAAEQGHVNALFSLGCCYREGEGVPNNADAQFECFRDAAEKGHADAQYNLATCYARGIGVAKNDAAAVALYRKLADDGAIDAKFFLGRCYDQGMGVETDKKAACTLFRAVIAKGNKKYHFPAQLLLARSLAADGLGDSQEALAARTRASEVPVHKHPLVRRNAIDVRSSDGRHLSCDICAAPGVPDGVALELC
jgi:TPR repeat protein